MIWGVMPLDGSTSVTLSITGEVATTIPQKYIPKQCCVFNVNADKSVNVTITDMDTTELVEAILNDAPIYVNLTHRDTSYWYTERLVCAPWDIVGSAGFDSDDQSMKDRIRRLILNGASPNKMSLVFHAYSLCVREVFNINILQT